MRIIDLVCDEDTEHHVWSRHRISLREVEQAVYNHGLAIRGRAKGVYEVYGRTDAGRYLMTAVRYVGKGEAHVITSRDMSDSERRRFGKYTSH